MSAAAAGVVLAGGLGTRMGEPKATALLAGRPLVAYPIEAMRAVCDRVAVVCKRDTELPELDVETWIEPDEPRHPVAGIIHALERVAGPVLVCAADMPLITPQALHLVAAGRRSTAAVAAVGGRLEPLLGAYAPDALGPLREAPPDQPLRDTAASLAPALVVVAPEVVFNINTPADLAEAERRLTSG
jgi:molybdenum cofactor guanylyltransferase